MALVVVFTSLVTLFLTKVFFLLLVSILMRVDVLVRKFFFYLHLHPIMRAAY